MTETQQQQEVDAILTEYNKVRDELICFTHTMHQTFFLSLGSASIILPIVTGTSALLPTDIVVFGCLVFAIAYAIIGMEFATSAFYINSLGGFTYTYLMPRLNDIIGTTETTRVLYWEVYMRRRHRSPASIFMATAGPASASILIVTPSLVSILLAQYIAGSSANQGMLIPGQELLTTLIPFTYWVAWVFFSLSVTTQIVNVVVSIKSGLIAEKHEVD